MTHSIGYPTGYLGLDFLNGYILPIRNDATGEMKEYVQLGILDGSINGIISGSGLGKSTLAIQMACNIIRRFESSTLFIEAAEVGVILTRLFKLSGFSSYEEYQKKVVVRDTGITTNSIEERLRFIHKLKMDNRDELLYDTGVIDETGKPIYKLEPTIMIIDSIKMLMPDKLQDEATNMSGAQTAKANSDLLTRMIPICREANIIIFAINHITTDVNTGITPKKPALAYLKMGENLPGGKALGYLQNNIFRLDQKVKLNIDKGGYEIDGGIVEISIVKSRSNKSGKSINLVFDMAVGYDPDLSMLETLKSNNLLEGAGAHIRLPGYPKAFAYKHFKTKLYEDPEMMKVFTQVCVDFLMNDLKERTDKDLYEKGVRANSATATDYMLNAIKL